LLRAEIALLDDLSRAPGEALAPLLRILSERLALGRCLPLRTAIATSVPPELESYVDPLGPSQLDRFAVQVRMRGLTWDQRWVLAKELLDFEPRLAAAPRLTGRQRRACWERVASLRIPPRTRQAFVKTLMRLRELAGADEAALLSDRVFGRAALRVLQAHALLRGATQVDPEDLQALRYMVARRLPEGLRAELAEHLQAIGNGEEASPPFGLARAGEGLGAGGEAVLEPVPVPTADRVHQPGEKPPQPRHAEQSARADVNLILRALEGQIERGRVGSREEAGGSPRSHRPLRRLDEIFDADPVDVVRFVEGCLPGGPSVYARVRRRASGSVAVLRDVSASMEGRLSRWAGDVVAGIVCSAARWRMRIGYVEFNHEAERYDADGRFFHRGYRRLLALADRRRAEGRTNYESPLALALDEFRGRARRNRHIVLLTDGVPVLGDPAVRRERTLARKLGVRVHTVFLGLGEHPAILEEISRETGGLAFLGRPSADGRLCVRERGERT
jgi:Mg-chelatase subunit ChlD